MSISTEIPQIVGRIRNEENPFRRQVFFIYNTWNGQKDLTDYLEKIEEKHQRSVKEMEYFNSAPDDIRRHLIKMIKREKTMCQDEDSYCYFDEGSREFALNNMSILAEEYEARVQYSTYRDSMYVFRALDERKELEVSDSATLITVSEHITNTITKTTFAEQMEQYCKYRTQEGAQFNFLSMDMERKNDKLRMYYNELGADRIKALGYSEKRMQNEILGQKNEIKIQMRFREMFPYGTELKADQFKLRMNKVYADLGINKKGKVSDLENQYGFKITQHNRVADNGRRQRYYEITDVPKFIIND